MSDYIEDCAKRRAAEFAANKAECGNYDEDDATCIWPWCDYCSFYCPKKEGGAE